jgi:pimeloyl-ACP methyl ester carboxylesterase
MPGARVSYIDLPGTGVYYKIPSPRRIPEILPFVRERMLEITASDPELQACAENRHLIAISLGGMVASEWLAKYPGDFKSCTLINTSFRGYSPLKQRLRIGALRHLYRAAVSSDPYTREEHVLKMISNRPEIRDQTAGEWAKIHASQPVSHENFLRQLAAAVHYRPPRHAPSVPVLILTSEKDRMVDPACSESIATRWHAAIARHPTAGHDLPLDDAAWIAGQIRNFLNGLSVASVDTPSRA